MKPFSQACENNKQPILNVLQKHFGSCYSVLEIGSGTGQHAVHFAAHMPQLRWHTSDLRENHPGIIAWLEAAQLPNVDTPITIDVAEPLWQAKPMDAVFTANTLHIMSWREVELFFKHLPSYVNKNGILAVYGPFNYQGKFTSDSNRQFNEWLKGQAAHRAIRDFEAVNGLAKVAGFTLLEDNTMPANNRLVIWQKLT